MKRCESKTEARTQAVRDEGWKLAAGRSMHISPGVEASLYSQVQQH